MALLKVHKVISALPSSLEANAIYIVRVGTGFQMYVTDATGAVAYSSNPPEHVSFTVNIAQATLEHKVFISDDLLSDASKVLVSLATGLQTDENFGVQVFTFVENVDAGFILHIRSAYPNQKIRGEFKFYYTIG